MSKKDQGVGFLGLGWSLPSIVRSNDYWTFSQNQTVSDELRNKEWFVLDRTTTGAHVELAPGLSDVLASCKDDPFHGARLRHILPDELEPSDMEAEAAGRALRAAHVAPEEIDAVLVASLVSDRLQPLNAPAVQHKCQLRNAVALGVEAGCASLLAQMVTAAGLIRDGSFRRVLIVQSAAFSLITDYSKPMSLTFGDGAAAAVIGIVPAGYGLLGQWMRTDGSLRDGVVYAPIIDGKPQRAWYRVVAPIRAASFDEELTKDLGRQTAAYCQEASLGALTDAGVTADQVGLFISTQTTGWFTEMCCRAVGLPRERSLHTFGEIANIGGAALIYNIARAQQQERLNIGNLILLYAQGAGLTRAAVVYRWHEGVGRHC